MRSRMHRLIALTVFSSLLIPLAAFADPGGRPRNLVVVEGGATALVTSMDPVDAQLSVVDMNGPTVSHLDVGGKSWGVAWVASCPGCDNPSGAVVTLPERTELAFVWRDPGTGQFTSASLPGVPYGCTEIIAAPEPGKVLIANRGASQAGPDSWRHSVLLYDVAGRFVERTFLAEREPRSLALATVSGHTYLFVGHAQGALELATDTELQLENDPVANKARDGGSVLMFEYATGNQVNRFAIGSPVRGLAVLPSSDAPGGSAPSGLAGGFRLFLTHLGDGAQSEDPGFGGRSIPNVVSSIRFNDQGVVVANGRQDVVVSHAGHPDDPNGDDFLGADLNPSNALGSRDQFPTVIPEKIALRWIPGAFGYTWEMWVTNSGSGTVTRFTLDATSGAIVTSGAPVNLSGAIPVVTGRQANGIIADSQVILGADATQATVSYGKAATPWNVYVGTALSGDLKFTSNPRGIVFDPGAGAMDAGDDRIVVVTQFDHEVVSFLASSPPTGATDTNGVVRATVGAGAVAQDERDFFTFGRGFDFREPGGVSVFNTSALVNELTCGSCHVDGHLDGKVRLTVRRGENKPANRPSEKPVAVPSIFDVGQTEWIFFEGTRTIADREAAGGAGCNYCSGTGFFFDTPGFTNAVTSPGSPSTDLEAVGGPVLGDPATRGRSYFEAMNCARCHATPSTAFCRSNEVDIAVPTVGPISTAANVLADPTQVFITFIPASTGGGSPVEALAPEVTQDNLSLRNMTDVGTRAAGDGIKNGINTPSLAGAWDNGPYLHDGRYRTLEQVLDHTWIDASWGQRAAPLWAESGVVDNAFNLPPGLTTTCPTSTPGALFAFGTHSDSALDTDRVSVSSFLNDVTQGPEALDDLLAFLRSASSRTDLCEPGNLTLSAVDVDLCGGSQGSVTLSWTTSLVAACRVEWQEGGGPVQVVITPAGTSHEATLTVTPGASGSATVIADSPLCGRMDSKVAAWTTPTAAVTISAIDVAHLISCEDELSWTTTSSVRCNVRWGTYGSGMPNAFVTAPGTDHSFTIPITPKQKYEIEVSVCDGGDVEYRIWKAPPYCVSQQPAISARPILGVSPNPFNLATRIDFRVETPGPVSVRVFTVGGRLVRTLVERDLDTGEYQESWSGVTDNGERVGPGIYYMTFSVPGHQETRKLVMY